MDTPKKKDDLDASPPKRKVGRPSLQPDKKRVPVKRTVLSKYKRILEKAAKDEGVSTGLLIDRWVAREFARLGDQSAA